MADKMKLGFKKDIHIEWINHALYLTTQGLPEKEIRKELDEYLFIQVTESGAPFTEGARSYIKPLLAVWFKANPVCPEFRDALIEEARNSSSSSWLPLHWAIMAVEYPLWYHVANQFGRLFSLQEVVKPSQIYSRIKDLHGDTETVARNTRYIIATMANWGIIDRIDGKIGNYTKPPLIKITDKVFFLLCESILRASGESMQTEAIAQDKSLYNFEYTEDSITSITMFSNNRVVSMQQGIGKAVLYAQK